MSLFMIFMLYISLFFLCLCAIAFLFPVSYFGCFIDRLVKEVAGGNYFSVADDKWG